MLRFLAAACLALSPCAAATQEAILIPHPPTYQEGERSTGVFVTTDGHVGQVLQRATRGPDGKMYLAINVLDEGGAVRARVVFDPRTWTGHAISEKERLRTLDTDCTPERLYPIFLGKVFECSSNVEINDRKLRVRSKVEFDRVELDPRGKPSSICAFTEDDDTETTMKARVCMSPDGKWMRRLHILQVEHSGKA